MNVHHDRWISSDIWQLRSVSKSHFISRRKETLVLLENVRWIKLWFKDTKQNSCGPVGPAASLICGPDDQFAGLGPAGPLYFQGCMLLRPSLLVLHETESEQIFQRLSIELQRGIATLLSWSSVTQNHQTLALKRNFPRIQSALLALCFTAPLWGSLLFFSFSFFSSRNIFEILYSIFCFPFSLSQTLNPMPY